uniref:Uncharacterized protein n=1 Tax=Romanomermis culicivorax TaxID=13658 RepID=A0A915KLU3_ROMCU
MGLIKHPPIVPRYPDGLFIPTIPLPGPFRYLDCAVTPTISLPRLTLKELRLNSHHSDRAVTSKLLLPPLSHYYQCASSKHV